MAARLAAAPRLRLDPVARRHPLSLVEEREHEANDRFVVLEGHEQPLRERVTERAAAYAVVAPRANQTPAATPVASSTAA